MRLNELTGIKTALTKAQNRMGPLRHLKLIDRVLEPYGFSSLGEGAFAHVYYHPNLDYVLKVFNRLDYGYLTFLRYAMANQGNPALPKIIGQPKKLSTDKKSDPELRALADWYFVRMERLEPLDISPASEFFGGMIQFVNKVVLRRTTSDDPKLMVTAETLKRIQTWEAGFPELAQVMRDLEELTERGGEFGFDLHEGNLMKRGNQIVVTDPLS